MRTFTVKIWIRISQIQHGGGGHHFVKVFHKIPVFFKGWLPLGEASFKKNWFFSEKIRKGGGISPNPKFPNQKMIEIFLDFFAERGGGLTQSKISVIRNCLFFFWKWGGVFPNPKFPYQKKLSFLLDFFCQKGGGLTYSKRVFIIKYWFLSSNTLFFHQILSFFF